ncbi:MAG: methyltransferase domain-containing protein [Armatimonadetes bacterium]|nr:methyltransferase domain-containing protein [Armatimonadota bacterium]
MGAVLTDLSYLVQAAFPPVARLLTPYFRWTYGRLAPHYENHIIARTLGYGEALRVALHQCDLTPRWCADIAAGTGSATRVLRRRHPQARVVAIDLSLSMLQELEGAEGVNRIVGTGWALPLASGGLDLAVLQNAPPSFVELARAVRPGGVVFFSLSAAGLIPASLRRWLLRRAVPVVLAPLGETTAGSGITWSFRRMH